MQLGSAAEDRSIEPDQAAAITDRRILSFRADALRGVLEQSGRSLGLVPQGPLREVRLDPDGQTVTVTAGEGLGARTRCLTGIEICAILIAWCLGAGVPLPAKARKRVNVLRGGVILEVLFAFHTLPRFRTAAQRGS